MDDFYMIFSFYFYRPLYFSPKRGIYSINSQHKLSGIFGIQFQTYLHAYPDKVFFFSGRNTWYPYKALPTHKK